MASREVDGLSEGAYFGAPESSSFTEFLAAHQPGLLRPRQDVPQAVFGGATPTAGPDRRPHGTTILALAYRDGVLIAGDRRATMGNVIAQKDLEKVHPADDWTAIAFAGTVGLAVDMVKLYQVELAHFEKIEGDPMSVGAKAARLAAMVRQNLAQAMQGLVMIPLLAAYDQAAPEGRRGRIFSYDVTGGPYERADFHAEGSGSPYARAALKKLFRRDMSRREAALSALQALYDAADDDSATSGPDVGRRIYPIVSVITEEGYERLSEAESEGLAREMIGQRLARPDGPVAGP